MENRWLWIFVMCLMFTAPIDHTLKPVAAAQSDDGLQWRPSKRITLLANTAALAAGGASFSLNFGASLSPTALVILLALAAPKPSHALAMIALPTFVGSFYYLLPWGIRWGARGAVAAASKTRTAFITSFHQAPIRTCLEALKSIPQSFLLPKPKSP